MIADEAYEVQDLRDWLTSHRPTTTITSYEARFETPASQQAQVDFARFVVNFTDAPGASCIVWLFSLVLSHQGDPDASFRHKHI